MSWIVPIITCSLVAIVCYFLGKASAEYDADLLKEMLPDISAEVYEDHESAETTIFITLTEKPAYSVKEIILNDGENLKLYQEAREI